MDDICKFCDFDSEFEKRILDEHVDDFGMLGEHRQVIYTTDIRTPSICISDEFSTEKDFIHSAVSKKIPINFCPFCGRDLRSEAF